MATLSRTLATHFCLAAVTICLLASVQSVHADSVDDYVKQQVVDKNIAGLAMVVLKDGKVIKHQACGLANIEHKVPMTLENVFPLASITKVFTATGVFLLVQDGKIRLDDKITRLVSGLPATWSEINVLDCLTHTSGLPDIPDLYEVFDAPGTQEAGLKSIALLPMVYKRGDKSDYNQTEFLILKMIIEKESGMPFEQFLSSRIFQPLGMKSAQFGDSRDVIPHSVSVYTRNVPAKDRFHSEVRLRWENKKDDKLYHSQLLFAEFRHAGAGLNMTALDLGKFDAALYEGRLLNQTRLKEMWTPYRLNNGKLGDFSAGWMTDPVNGHRMVYHIGAGMAQYSSLVDKRISLIVLTNVQSTKVKELSLGILKCYVPDITLPTPAARR
jgi:CubicO group peptidase (beta-lactamase class C family)